MIITRLRPTTVENSTFVVLYKAIRVLGADIRQIFHKEHKQERAYNIHLG